MRPEILYPLFAPVIKLPGIGPRTGKLVEKLAGPQIVDLLWHLPSGLIDRRFAPKIADAPDGAIATIKSSLDELSGQLNDLADAMPGGDVIAKLGEKLAALETSLSQLGRVVEQTASAGGGAALDLLNREFEILKSRLVELARRQPASTAATAAAVTPRPLF